MPTGIYTRTQEAIKNMSLAHAGQKGFWTGKKLSEKHIQSLKTNHSGMAGLKHQTETRKKMSNSAKKRVQEGRNNLWKGGITSVNMQARMSLEYKLWRESVFRRDNYTCQECGDNQSGNLNADHIKPFAYFPELRFAIDNGRTLCVDCHKKTDTWGQKARNLYE